MTMLLLAVAGSRGDTVSHEQFSWASDEADSGDAERARSMSRRRACPAHDETGLVAPRSGRGQGPANLRASSGSRATRWQCL